MKGLAWGITYALLLVTFAVTSNAVWFAPTAAFFENHGNMASFLATFFGPLMAATIAIIAANKQVNAWRIEARSRRKAEVAEAAILAVAEIDEALKYIRDPFDRVSADDRKNPRGFYERIWNRVSATTEEFEKLQKAQILLDAHFDAPALQISIDALLRIRRDIQIAIELSLETLRDTDPGIREMREEWRRTISGSYTEEDKAGQKQKNAVKQIRESLKKFVRYED